jgi:hypothetical protein
VFEFLKTLALAGRRATLAEAGVSPFRLPRQRSLSKELATARAFIEEAATRQAAFERFGLPRDFLAEFQTMVGALQRASDVRISSKTVRRRALAGIRTALAQGLDAARDLDVIVAIAARRDPTTIAAWRSARRIEGQRARPARTRVAAAVPMLAPASSAVGPPFTGDSSAVAAPAVPLSATLTMPAARGVTRREASSPTQPGAGRTGSAAGRLSPQPCCRSAVAVRDGRGPASGPGCRPSGRPARPGPRLPAGP